MDGYEPRTYGDAIADLYDDWMATGSYEQAAMAAAEFLAELCRGGRALELGIGTGRVALPLAARGVEVHGIDASEAMVARLRAKPGGTDLPVTIGDFADVPVGGTFDAVYVVFNTLFALDSQDEQVRCLTNVADRLGPGGHLVVEAFVPDVARFDRRQRVQVAQIDTGQVRLDVSRHDPVAQTITSQHVIIDSAGLRLVPVHLRYCWPSELDVMCRLAGLSLVDRFGDWTREPFTAASGAHVSVYARAPGP